MKNKKIISLLLAIVLIFGTVSTAYASVNYTFIDSFECGSDLTGRTLTFFGDFDINDTGSATITMTIKRATSENSGWSVYDTYSETFSCPTSDTAIYQKTVPTGYYYYAIITLRYTDAASGRTESATIRTATVH